MATEHRKMFLVIFSARISRSCSVFLFIATRLSFQFWTYINPSPFQSSFLAFSFVSFFRFHLWNLISRVCPLFTRFSCSFFFLISFHLVLCLCWTGASGTRLVKSSFVDVVDFFSVWNQKFAQLATHTHSHRHTRWLGDLITIEWAEESKTN